MATFTAGQTLTATNLGAIKESAVSFTAGITGGGAFAIGNGTKAGEQQAVAGRNYVKMIYTFGSTSNQGTGAWTWAGFTAAVAGPSVTGTTVVGRWYYIRPASTARSYGSILMTVGASSVVCAIDTTALGAFTAIGAAVPEAWATGAIIELDFNYPIL